MYPEYADRFAVRPKPSMQWVHRNARLIEIERRIKIDLLHQQADRLVGPAYFNARMKLRAEILDLHRQWR